VFIVLTTLGIDYNGVEKRMAVAYRVTGATRKG
jgi:hypothetical protein